MICFLIDTLYGLKDRRTDLRTGMELTLEWLAEISKSTYSSPDP